MIKRRIILLVILSANILSVSGNILNLPVLVDKLATGVGLSDDGTEMKQYAYLYKYDGQRRSASCWHCLWPRPLGFDGFEWSSGNECSSAKLPTFCTYGTENMDGKPVFTNIKSRKGTENSVRNKMSVENMADFTWEASVARRLF